MRKSCLKVWIMIIVAGLLLEVPSAYAILGVRAARAALAARKAEKALASGKTEKAPAPTKTGAGSQEVPEETVPASRGI